MNNSTSNTPSTGGKSASTSIDGKPQDANVRNVSDAGKAAASAHATDKGVSDKGSQDKSPQDKGVSSR